MAMPENDEFKLLEPFLALLVKMISAKTVLEVGMFTGYASLSLAEALSKDGCIYSLEQNKDYCDFASQYFNKSEHGKKNKNSFR